MTKKEELIRFSGTLPVDLSKEFKKQAIREQRSLNVVFNNAIKLYLSQVQSACIQTQIITKKNDE